MIMSIKIRIELLLVPELKKKKIDSKTPESMIYKSKEHVNIYIYTNILKFHKLILIMIS